MPLLQFRCLIMLMAMGLSGLSWSSGIEDSTPEQRAALQTGFMKDQLKLSAETLLKVDAINLKYAQASEPVLKGSDGIFQKRSKMQSIMDSKDQELKKVLSEDEFQRYNSIKDEIKPYLESHL